MNNPNDTLETLRTSRKYRPLDLPADTLQDLYARELAAGRNNKDALKATRRKLHNIVAPYLGDPDYAEASRLLEMAFPLGMEDVKAACAYLLSRHASTRERLPALEEFYSAIFSITGRPKTILDLACGLNPFALPWMGLSADTRYHAYDLHKPRVDLVNQFLCLMNLPPLAEQSDILLFPPSHPVDVAFFFKEAHRLEQRRRGSNRQFWQQLRANWLVVSLPSTSMTGAHDLRAAHRRLVARTLEGQPWPVSELEVNDELIFCIHKGNESGHRPT